MKQYTSLTCFSDIHTLQILSAVAGMLPISGIQDNDSSVVLFLMKGITILILKVLYFLGLITLKFNS